MILKLWNEILETITVRMSLGLRLGANLESRVIWGTSEELC